MRRRDFMGVAAVGLVALAAPRGPRQLWASGISAVPRRRDNFNDGWLFRRQAHGGGALGSFDRNPTLGTEVEARFRNASQADYDDSNWDPVFLPHTWNAFDAADEIPGYFRGLGWYRKHFRLGEELKGKRIFLEFEGVNQVAELWLNGTAIGTHTGGYTGFEFDITEQAHFGGLENIVTVQVNNVYNPNIGPTVKTDVTFYGGIYRDVWLRISEPVYCSKLYWRTPRVSESFAEVEIYGSLANSTPVTRSLDVLIEVLDPTGAVVGKSTGKATAPPGNSTEFSHQTLRLSSPKLWHPDSPNLYRVRAGFSQNSELIDSLEIPLGFRFFRFDPDHGFFLNGKRLQLRGTTWHQVYPGMGNAVPNSRHFADMKIIREMGCNFFRTSHYPHDPAVMEACDQLGLLVLDEIFVGEEVETNPEYVAIQTRQAEEMIFRDRNYPSVIMWGISGEVDQPEKSADMINGLVNKYRELDPTRIATMHAPRIEPVMANLDVVGLYSTFEDDDRDHKNFPQRKYLIEEYTAAGIGRGLYGMGENSEDAGCSEHEKFLSQVNLRPWIAGSVLWHQFDYDGEEYDPVVPHVVTFGMNDSWRIPKDVYYFFQSQWATRPMVHICGHWTWPDDQATRRVKVYSNLEEVELVLNGKSLGTRKGDTYPGLVHAPRVWEVAYVPGTLTAVGRSGAQTVSDTRKTAGKPAAIVLVPDVKVLRSGDRESLAYLTASVVDKDGTVVPDAFHPVSFTSYGPGELLPQIWAGYPAGFTWNAIAGMTAIALRATDHVGRCVVSAYSPGLQLGRAEVQIARKGQRDQMEHRGGATLYQ